MMNLLIMGPPGAGKGTQAEVISNEVNLKHLSSGDLLRAAVKNGTDLGKKADGYMKAGELVPDELMIAMIIAEVNQVIASDSGFLLDGFPRTVEQAEALDRSFAEQGVKIDKIINLSVDNDVIVGRLTSRRVCTECGGISSLSDLEAGKETVCPNCGASALIARKDDKEEVIRQRLEVYQESTFPIINYYKQNHSVLEIDGCQEKDTITAFILSEIRK